MNAARGLLSFAIVDLTEEDVALMQKYHKDLLKASLISTSEVKATLTNLISSTLTGSEGFMMMLKRITNLLFALFS